MYIEGGCIMALDPKVQDYMTRITALNAPPLKTLTADQARAGFVASQKALASLAAKTQDVHVEDALIEGPYGEFPVRIYFGDHDAHVPVCVFYHGGGFVLGDIESYDHVVRGLQRASGAVLISVGYHRPPEFKFPVPVEECFTALQWAAANAARWNADPQCLFVAGDSAGGNFAAVVAQRAKSSDMPLRGQILFYPATDMLAVTESKQLFGQGYLLENDDMAWFGEMYLRTMEDALSPEASPARAQTLAGLAPAFVATAEYDPLRDEGEEYARALQNSGVKVWSHRYEGVIHGFISVPVFDQAATVMKDAARFILEECKEQDTAE